MKKKILIISLIMTLILGVLTITTNAASTNTFTTTMTANNSKVEAGSEVLINVKLSNLNVGDTGINGFSAYLSYDTNMFETLTDSSVDGANGWVASYNTGSGNIKLYKQTFLKTDEEIMQITLKTKSGLADGTQGEVKLSTIIASNSSDEYMDSPKSVTITIGSGNSSDSVSTNTISTNSIIITPTNSVVTPQLPVTNTSNNTSVVPSNNTISNNITTNQILVTNQSGNDIPYTGSDSNALGRIIVGVIFIGLVLFIKIERMNKDIK